MRKNYVLVFMLVFVLVLAGCNRGRTITGDTIPDEKTEEHLLTVTAGGESIRPYQHFLFSGQWDGKYFVCADGASLATELKRLNEEGLIPQLNYSEDFEVISENGEKLGYIGLYDSKYKELESLQSVSGLAQLNSGEYYVGITVTKEGEYIDEVKKNEYIGYASEFVPTVNLNT